jgi:FkbM family methyltransferase
MMNSPSKIRTETWRPSNVRAVLGRVAYPIFLLLNRPSLSWFGKLSYDFALRCNGIAITFAGQHGLTRAEERFLDRHAHRLRNGILLDVGANGGAYARYLSRLAPTARIFAFEPHPRTFAALADNLVGEPSIELINKAVGETSGHFALYDFADNDGSTQASLSVGAVALFTPDITAHDVDCTTVDTFMADKNLSHIDLLKIDTEGHDLAVLRGARNALSEQRIRMIQFEFIAANIATGATMHGFFEVLAGYDIYRLCLNGSLLPLGSYDVKRHEIYVTHNLIALPRVAR